MPAPPGPKSGRQPGRRANSRHQRERRGRLTSHKAGFLQTFALHLREHSPVSGPVRPGRTGRGIAGWAGGYEETGSRHYEVLLDDMLGARLGAGHLIALGHCRIAQGSGARDHSSFLARTAGYRPGRRVRPAAPGFPGAASNRFVLGPVRCDSCCH